MNEANHDENPDELAWVAGSLHHQLPAPTPPPSAFLLTPTITVVRSVDELRNLPTETVLSWTEGIPGPTAERRAAVLFVDEDDIWISHTGHSNWSTSIEHIQFPAQAFIWPKPEIV
ncbi:Uncharacterised protein [Mycobacteroides abscessus subsp. massiliense]|uniref:hypothetical protein n=1 Tax=Mycobacteroides abscessus TaxID=36809 RepID=UPI0009A6B759|nr:hypothetical protein [Mycobacteroides abscessus]SLE83356.1 Uncharacterised protein [Mycobacteroides abscessus subsp. massiliense]